MSSSLFILNGHVQLSLIPFYYLALCHVVILYVVLFGLIYHLPPWEEWEYTFYCVLFLSRFAISGKVSAWTNSKLIIAVVAKLTFDLLPEQPSCNVTGLSSVRRGSFATCARLGVTASMVLPESKSV